MAQRSLLLKLLALKANDEGCSREDLVRDIFQAVGEQSEELTDEQKILVDRFVNYYAALPRQAVNNIKKEAGMTFVASTLSEQLRHEGEEHGKEIGKEIGRLEGALANLRDLFEQKLISKDVYEARSQFLRQELTNTLVKERHT